MNDRVDALYQRFVRAASTPPPARRALKTAAILVREITRRYRRRANWLPRSPKNSIMSAC